MKIIEMSGSVGWEITASNFKSQLNSGVKDDVLLKVNSPGGFVFEGFEIYNLIKDYKKETGKTVNVLINGLAASAASYFIMAADKIIIRENSVFMAHKAWNFAIGDSDDMKKESEILSGIDSILASAYSQKTGKSKEDILNEMKDEIWLFGDEIQNAGYADESEPIEELATEIEAFTKSEAMAKVNEVKNRIANFYALKDSEKKATNSIIQLDKNEKSCNDNKTKNKKEEVSMSSFNEFLKQNPNAVAEVETSDIVKNAIASGIKAEKERVNELLSLSGLQISDTLKHAIENNLNAGDFAKAEVKAQNEKRKNESGVQELGKIMTSSQTPKDSHIDEAPKAGSISVDENEIKNWAKKQAQKKG